MTTSRLKRALAAVALLSVVTGCATGGGSNTTMPDAAEDVQIVKPSRPMRIKNDDEDGFTISESVRVSAQVRAAHTDALALIDSGRIAEGMTALQDVVAQAPELTTPHINLGVLYLRTGELDKAQASLEHALALTPDHPVALNELGIVYRRTGRFQEARANYERALEVLPEFHFAQRNLGVLCDLILQDTACALTHYRAYAEGVPDDEEVSMWIADLEARNAG